MSLDISSLLGNQRALRIAKADYDWGRDGGAVGVVPLNSEVIPDGSIILGGCIRTTAPMTFDTTGAIAVWLGPTQVGVPNANANYQRSWWWYDVPEVVTDANRALSAFISNDVCTNGAFTVWLFYLPTVDF